MAVTPDALTAPLASCLCAVSLYSGTGRKSCRGRFILCVSEVIPPSSVLEALIRWEDTRSMISTCFGVIKPRR